MICLGVMIIEFVELHRLIFGVTIDASYNIRFITSNVHPHEKTNFFMNNLFMIIKGSSNIYKWGIDMRGLAISFAANMTKWWLDNYVVEIATD